MTSAKRASLCVVFCGITFAVGLKSQTLDKGATQGAKTYTDSRSGIEEQFADILQVVRTSDEASIHKALDTLSIPDANEWIAAHFPAERVSQEQQSYRQHEKFQSHVWWVTGNFGKYPEFVLKVEESQNARPLSDVGFEGLVPRPKDAVKVENYRFVSTVTESETRQSVLGELVCLS